MDWTDYTRFGITLFALINPFTKIPYCLSVCGPGNTKALHRLALSSTVSMIVLVCVTSGLVIGAGGLLSRVLGAVFFSIVGRLSGLIVVAVGVEVVWHGLATHIATLG